MESKTLSSAKKSLGTAIKVADNYREIENGKEYPINLSILGTGKNEGTLQSFQGTVSFQGGVGKVSSNLYKQLGMGATIALRGDSIELHGKDTDEFAVTSNANGINIIGREKDEQEIDLDNHSTTPSKKESVKHDRSAASAKDHLNKQRLTDMRKHRQDLISETNKLMDQDFQTTIRGMHRMMRLLNLLNQINFKAADTLADSSLTDMNFDNYEGLNNAHKKVDKIVHTLCANEKEAQNRFHLEEKERAARNYNNTSLFKSMTKEEQVDFAHTLRTISERIATKTGKKPDEIAKTLFSGFGVNIYDSTFDRSSKYSAAYKLKTGPQATYTIPDNPKAETAKALDLSKVTKTDIAEIRKKGATTRKERSVLRTLEYSVYGDNLLGQNIHALQTLENQQVYTTKKGDTILLKLDPNTKKSTYIGKLHTDKDGLISAIEFPVQKNESTKKATIRTLEDLHATTLDNASSQTSSSLYNQPIDSSTMTFTVPVSTDKTHESSSYIDITNAQSFSTFDYANSSSPSNSSTNEIIVESPQTSTPASTEEISISEDQDTSTINNYINAKASTVEIDLDHSHADWNAIFVDNVTNINQQHSEHKHSDPKFVKAHQQMDLLCEKLKELPSLQSEEYESLEESFNDRTMRLIFTEMKISRVEMKQKLTEEADILSKDKSLSATRRKQLLAKKQEDIKKQQQKRLQDRILKQKLEQRQVLTKLLLKQSEERVTLATAVENCVDEVVAVHQNHKCSCIDQATKKALNHINIDIAQAEQKCAELYAYYDRMGLTSECTKIIDAFSEIQDVKEQTHGSKYSDDRRSKEYIESVLKKIGCQNSITKDKSKDKSKNAGEVYTNTYTEAQAIYNTCPEAFSEFIAAADLPESQTELIRSLFFFSDNPNIEASTFKPYQNYESTVANEAIKTTTTTGPAR